MHLNKEAIIATSYIAKDGDEKNRCYLSKESLFVRYKGRLEKFALEEVTDIRFKHKLYLLPIIIGGIISPFCLLALVNAIGNPWLLLSGMVIGLLSIYYGYEGSPTLSIATRVKEFDFFINKPTPNLFAFTKFASQIFKYGEQGSLFYLNLTPEQIISLNQKGFIDFEREVVLFYYDEIAQIRAPLYGIDPTMVGTNFQLKLVDGKIIPVLSGEISKEYILSPNS